MIIYYGLKYMKRSESLYRSETRPLLTDIGLNLEKKKIYIK